MTTPLKKLKSAPQVAPQVTPQVANNADIIDDWSDTTLTKTGAQQGSNPGGYYHNADTGADYYLKFTAEDIARNEVLAGQLYRLAGVEVPELSLVRTRDGLAVASRIIEGVTAQPARLAAGGVAGAEDALAIDAWLANWDVTGLSYDNLLVTGNRAVRIDVGGALRYRAQGGQKGAAFGPRVTELDSLRDPATNRQSAALFAHTTEEQIEAGVRRILAIPDSALARTVELYGPTDNAARADLLATLRARRADLAARYPNAGRAPTAAPSHPSGRLTEADLQQIAASRVNGYAIPRDKDAIEDQQILLSHYTAPDGSPYTRAWLKLRPNETTRLASETATALVDTHQLADELQSFLRGVGAQAKKGEAYRATDLARWTQIEERISATMNVIRDNRASMDVTTDTEATAYIADLISLRSELRGQYKTLTVGEPAVAFPRLLDTTRYAKVFNKPGAPGAIPWNKLPGWDYNLAMLERSFETMTTGTDAIWTAGEVLGADIEGASVKLVTAAEGNGLATRGLMQIDVAGADAAAAEKALATLERLQVNAAVPDAADTKELWLNKQAWAKVVTDQTERDAWQRLDDITDQTERVAAKERAVSRLIGRDVTTAPEYAAMRRGAFDHGRLNMERADFDPDAWAAFSQEHLLYHNPTGLSWGASFNMWDNLKPIFEGGGQLTTALDRARRGLPQATTSAASDLSGGGGSYVFTRIANTRRYSPESTAGVWWRPTLLKRLDAISYPSDNFGNTTLATQARDRATNLKTLAQYAEKGRNETIFKDGLSFFEDLERLVFPSENEAQRAITDLRAMGYTTWPDGRALEDVITWTKR